MRRSLASPVRWSWSRQRERARLRARIARDRHPLWLLGGAVGRLVRALQGTACRSGTSCSTASSRSRTGRAGLTRSTSSCYDTTKILLLLVGIIFVARILRSFLSIERTRALLGGRREGRGNVAAACLGVATPFCSCSAVPAFIGFVAAGVPLGITLTFLIASPMVNEVAVVLLYGMFGFEDRRALRRLGPADRDRRRRHPRPPAAGALHRALRARGRREGRRGRHGRGEADLGGAVRARP